MRGDAPGPLKAHSRRWHSATLMGRRKQTASADATETPAARFLRQSELCHARDLSQLMVLAEPVRAVSELIHALQKERGASSIHLGSHGSRFTEQLRTRARDSAQLEIRVRERLEHIDGRLDSMRAGGRFYRRIALVFSGLDALPHLRTQISTLRMAASEAVRAFSDVIAQLLAVGIEAADLAADPATSSALLALVSLAQGKEYAGQERATAAAAFSRGQFEPTDHQRLRRLQEAQQRAFRLFARFARIEQVSAFEQAMAAVNGGPLEQLRAAAIGEVPVEASTEDVAATWYDLATRRIDAMKQIEDVLATAAERRCGEALCSTKGISVPLIAGLAGTSPTHSAAPVAMLVAELSPIAEDLGLSRGIDLYTLDDTLPKPMRAILTVLDAQARVIDDVSGQLRNARTALSDRKLIERAKGVLMRTRRLSEQSAYDLLRHTAMGQNKRLIEVAEAVIGATDLFKP